MFSPEEGLGPVLVRGHHPAGLLARFVAGQGQRQLAAAPDRQDAFDVDGRRAGVMPWPTGRVAGW